MMPMKPKREAKGTKLFASLLYDESGGRRHGTDEDKRDAGQSREADLGGDFRVLCCSPRFLLSPVNVTGDAVRK